MDHQSDGAVIRAHKLRDTNDFTTVIDNPATLHAHPKYITMTEGQNDGTLLGWHRNVASATTTGMSAHNIGNITTKINPSSLSSSPLTEATLANHDARMVYNQSLDELQRSNRVDAIIRAARELGIDLPRESFEPAVWELSLWIEVQNHFCVCKRQL